MHIVAAQGKFLGFVNKLREFVEHLLRARGGSPLDLCELRLGDFADKNWFTYEDMLRCFNHWIRHAVGCRVQVLRLLIHCNEYLELEDQPLVSQHLRRLEIGGVEVYTGLLNFSGCPNLEHLEFENC
uniref:Uncharacterized protein n=1 Tax=Arundo donax TaxID=35708 RepID=A0A0A9GWJ9_ARUDO